ncbi:MAG: hypothetical protein CMM27_12985 [Rhodospirillaceae bacterium]|nr:hypothetical protein [Rhodospirillaceae bacterium]|tara:strand:- start:269 stop:523 length:255 start_codon:yes stop_codon:yes gene_type:complete
MVKGSGAKYANGNYKNQQKAYNKTKKGLELRVNANAINRRKKTYGNGDGLDVAHKKGKESSRKAKDATLQKPSTNRRSRLKTNR